MNPTSFQPTEQDLTALGFRTNSPAQPYPTRSYFVELPNHNFLALTPRPGLRVACEYTPAGRLIAKHLVEGPQDLLESVRGAGRREVVGK